MDNYQCRKVRYSSICGALSHDIGEQLLCYLYFQDIILRIHWYCTLKILTFISDPHRTYFQSILVTSEWVVNPWRFSSFQAMTTSGEAAKWGCSAKVSVFALESTRVTRSEGEGEHLWTFLGHGRRFLLLRGSSWRGRPFLGRVYTVVGYKRVTAKWVIWTHSFHS